MDLIVVAFKATMRGMIISWVSYRNKQQNNERQRLIAQIEQLEHVQKKEAAMDVPAIAVLKNQLCLAGCRKDCQEFAVFKAEKL